MGLLCLHFQKNNKMGNSKLKGKHLLNIGYTEGKIIGIALNATQSSMGRKPRAFKLKQLETVLKAPEKFVDDDHFWQVAKELLLQEQKLKDKVNFALKTTLPAFNIYGEEHIEQGALHQMNLAMKLPVAKAGALMPDAHHGYGLPIGGVLATENSVIPFGVGVDIGCRMAMSILPLSPSLMDQDRFKFLQLLQEHTCFGNKQVFSKPIEHEVLDKSAFKENPVLKQLQDRAYRQIGTSGGGNHFVEFGVVEITEPDPTLGVEAGKYLGILSHSGSRGLGANIAKYYTQKAQEQCSLPKEARHLSWLNLDTDLGQEYWQAMNLAGDYASACHHQIHFRLTRALGVKAIATVENHHNFAWKEQDEHGNQMVVHRKGATPAGKDVLGIIPGSMTAPGFIVKGLGNHASLNSASHGAGRTMSRMAAKNSIPRDTVKKHLREHRVDTIGGGVDEAPMAYKDIHKVMECQTELVDVLGKFIPKVVRME